MYRTITKDVTVADGTIGTVNIITGRTGMTTRIAHVYFEKVNDTDVVGFVDQDQIVDFGAECNAGNYQIVNVDRVLDVGETFAAGLRNNTGREITAKVTVEVEETPG